MVALVVTVIVRSVKDQPAVSPVFAMVSVCDDDVHFHQPQQDRPNKPRDCKGANVFGKE
jgi:hypothetical protein